MSGPYRTAAVDEEKALAAMAASGLAHAAERHRRRVQRALAALGIAVVVLVGSSAVAARYEQRAVHAFRDRTIIAVLETKIHGTVQYAAYVRGLQAEEERARERMDRLAEYLKRAAAKKQKCFCDVDECTCS